MIPSPLVLICLVRGLWRSITHGALVLGHNYYICKPQQDQPKVAHVMRCTTCGSTNLVWERVEEMN